MISVVFFLQTPSESNRRHVAIQIRSTNRESNICTVVAGRESKELGEKTCPIQSTYGIFSYIWLTFMANVGKYSIYGCYGCGNQNCLWIKNHLFSVSLHAHPWGFIKGGLLHLANLLTKKLQHLSLCWSSLDVSYMMVWSQSSSTPTLAVFNKMIQLRWVILTMAYWCLCQTACVNGVFFLAGKTRNKKHMFFGEM